MKLKRSAYVTFLNPAFSTTAGEWFKIGKDISELSVDLNPDTSSVKNIWDETSVTDNGYQPSFEATPYYANPEDSIYEKLRDIAMERKSGDECKTLCLEVIVEDTSADHHLAWTEEVVVKPSSYGGGTEGFAIPFTVTFAGNRKKGYVSLDGTGKPTFTEGDMP